MDDLAAESLAATRPARDRDSVARTAAPEWDWHSRTAVLIGGGTGIGYAVAQRVTSAGGTVILGGRSESRLTAAAKKLGPTAHHRVVDVDSSESVADFFRQVERVDALLTTAADYRTGSFRSLTEDEARSPFESKFWGQYRVARAALDVFSDDGAIVLMSGAAGVRPVADAPAYVAANAALDGLARGLAFELAPIRVNSVSPGTVDGHLWDSRAADIREQAMKGYSELALLSRPGTEAEIAGAVVHLFENTYISATTLYVDGGFAQR